VGHAYHWNRNHIITTAASSSGLGRVHVWNPQLVVVTEAKDLRKDEVKIILVEERPFMAGGQRTLGQGSVLLKNFQPGTTNTVAFTPVINSRTSNGNKVTVEIKIPQIGVPLGGSPMMSGSPMMGGPPSQTFVQQTTQYGPPPGHYLPGPNPYGQPTHFTVVGGPPVQQQQFVQTMGMAPGSHMLIQQPQQITTVETTYVPPPIQVPATHDIPQFPPSFASSASPVQPQPHFAPVYHQPQQEVPAYMPQPTLYPQPQPGVYQPPAFQGNIYENPSTPMQTNLY